MTLEEQVRSEIVEWCEFIETWLKQGGEPESAAVASLIKRIGDPALRDKVKQTTDPKTVRAAYRHVKLFLPHDLGSAYSKWRSFQNDRQFVEGMLNADSLRRGRKTLRAASEGGKERAKEYGFKKHGPKWQRVVNRMIKTNSYRKICESIADRDKCAVKTVQRYTTDPTKK